MTASGTEITVFDHRTIEDSNYWVRTLAGAGPSNLRLDSKRPSAYSPHNECVAVELSGASFDSLVKLTGNGPFLLYTTLVAALNVCLYKYTGKSAIVVGSPIRARDDGMYQAPNAVAIVSRLEEQISFRELLMAVRQTLLDAYDRQRYPIHRLIKDLNLDGAVIKCPLFDIVVELAEIHEKSPELKNDITISWSRTDDKLQAQFSFCNALFKKQTIERFADNILVVLKSIPEKKDSLLRDMNILTEAETRQLLVEWSTVSGRLPDTCFHELFETQVDKTPETIAVIFNNEFVTYRELNERANRVAHRLQSLGVSPETLVAICAERSASMIAAILGILKAGGAYVPLDPAYPAERLAIILKDAQVDAVITQSRFKEIFSEHLLPVICLDDELVPCAAYETENPAGGAVPGNMAYVIYTSGSTGTPKGVMITHRGLVNYLIWSSKAYAIDQGSGAPVHSSIGFDLTITALFLPLVAGKSVVLIDENEGIEGLIAALRENSGFSFLKVTPAHLDLIKQGLDPAEPANRSRALIIGGEALFWEHISFWQTHAPETIIVNEYGPTETVVGCCTYEVAGSSESSGTNVPIGRPIANTEIYLLDRNYSPAAVGALGEIHVGGEGLARGYLDRPALTGEKFIPNPYCDSPGARLYRTGDIAAYRSDGNIEFVGRIDNQVKIRGYRVELGEIESVLREHPAIKECAVLVKSNPDGDLRLTAYLYSEENGLPSIAELQDFLARRLPDYMVPSLFVACAELPLTANGKVDRNALLSIEGDRVERKRTIVPPRSPVEEAIAGIWSEVLGVEPAEVSMDDSFFALGGHSLLATRVVTRIRKAFNINLTLRRMFESPTIAGLAVAVVQRQAEQQDDNEILRMLREIEQLTESEARSLYENAR